MPKILVTGGAGYIGSITARLLSRRGYSVVVVDDLSRGQEHNLSGLPFHKLNVADTPALSDLLAREAIDAVIHFAAYIAVGESTQKPELYFSNNVGGTLSLLTAMVQTNVKRIVFLRPRRCTERPRWCRFPKTRRSTLSVHMANRK
jgi:UDP-glucose 4-epimerase